MSKDLFPSISWILVLFTTLIYSIEWTLVLRILYASYIYHFIVFLIVLCSPLDLPIPLLPESSSAVPSRFPLQWAPVREDVDYSRHPLSTSLPEFKLAESCFRKSIPQGKATIIAIERVQNPFMWEKYAR